MKKQFLVGLVAVIIVIITAIPTLASNSSDEYFTNFVVVGNGGDAIYDTSRAKEDASALFLEILDMTYYSVRVRALGTSHYGGNNDPLTVYNTTNRTCSISDYQISWPYVLCLEDVDYSIHSGIYEYGHPRATFGCTNVYVSYTYIAGRWSPDSIYAHTDAYYPD